MSHNNDLISRSALLEAMPKNDEIFSSEVRRVICNTPAVDAEVVRHGRWYDRGVPGYSHMHDWCCSVCKCTRSVNPSGPKDNY